MTKTLGTIFGNVGKPDFTEAVKRKLLQFYTNHLKIVQVLIVQIRGVKLKAQGPELAWQRLQSGPLDSFGKYV